MANVALNIEGLVAEEIGILEHMAAMIDEGVDLTSSDKPGAPALSARAGVEVSAKQRNTLMKHIQLPEDEDAAEEVDIVEMAGELAEMARPPSLNQTHLRPSDHQRLTDIHGKAQELLKAVKGL